MRHFGFEAIFFASLCIESLLFGRPGFDPRRLQTLRAHNFVALGPTGSKTIFFENSDLSLLGLRKKISFAALLRVLLIGQSTIKLYHKKQIDRERLKPAVYVQNKESIWNFFISYHNIMLLITFFRRITHALNARGRIVGPKLNH